MKFVDAGLLLYAYDSDSPFHGPARAFWESCLSGSEPIGLAWQTISAFVRTGTNPRVFSHPMTLEEACSHVDEWLGRPMVEVRAETDSHWPLFRRLLIDGQASGNLVTDAHLAALTISYGSELRAADNDFSRFTGLRWKNPLRGRDT